MEEGKIRERLKFKEEGLIKYCCGGEAGYVPLLNVPHHLYLQTGKNKNILKCTLINYMTYGKKVLSFHEMQ